MCVSEKFIISFTTECDEEASRMKPLTHIADKQLCMTDFETPTQTVFNVVDVCLLSFSGIRGVRSFVSLEITHIALLSPSVKSSAKLCRKLLDFVNDKAKNDAPTNLELLELSPGVHPTHAALQVNDLTQFSPVTEPSQPAASISLQNLNKST